MASALEQLALGLRQAGGVLSPNAFQALSQEDAQNAALQRQVQLAQLQQQVQDAREKTLSGVVAPFLEKQDLEGAAAAAAKSGVPGSAAMALKLTDAAEARKARALQAAQMLDLRQTALDQQKDLALQRARDQSERDAVNNTFKQAQLELAQRNSELNNQLKTMGLDLQKLRLEQQQSQQTNTRTQQLSAALEKANLPEADAVLGAVEKSLDSNPNLAKVISGPGSLVPDAVLPNDLAAGRQAFQKLFNITLKNRSGAAVTVPEFERLKAEFGNGAFKTPEQLRNAVQQARNIINKHYASIASGFGPEVLKSYNQNVRGFGGNVVLDPEAQQAQPSSSSDPLGIRK